MNQELLNKILLHGVRAQFALALYKRQNLEQIARDMTAMFKDAGGTEYEFFVLVQGRETSVRFQKETK